MGALLAIGLRHRFAASITANPEPSPMADESNPFERQTEQLPDPVASHDRLRAFEDEHLGEGAVRIHGRVERGFGSKFKDLPIEKQQAHAAIEKTAETERKLGEARAAVAVAENEHNAAIEAADKAVAAIKPEQEQDPSRLGSG